MLSKDTWLVIGVSTLAAFALCVAFGWPLSKQETPAEQVAGGLTLTTTTSDETTTTQEYVISDVPVDMGAVTIMECIGLLYDPTVRHEDGSPVTDEEKGLALLQSIREMRGRMPGGRIVWKPDPRCPRAFPVRMKINGELLLEIEEPSLVVTTTSTVEASTTTTGPVPELDSRFRGEMELLHERWEHVAMGGR